VEVAEADLRGVALHETARMLSQAGANEIIVSATTKALASASELRFIDLGERELRGLPDSYRLYRLDAR
jgi:class 3 adenylate cyclase